MTRENSSALLRRQMDKKLSTIRDASRAFSLPSGGWIRAISKALGMPGSTLAKRMGIAQPTLAKMQRGEVSGSITLSSLERAAEALDCKLVYAFVPKTSLEQTTKEQAHRVAKKMGESVAQSMALEAQSIPKSEQNQQVKQIAEDLIRSGGRKLWSE